MTKFHTIERKFWIELKIKKNIKIKVEGDFKPLKTKPQQVSSSQNWKLYLLWVCYYGSSLCLWWRQLGGVEELLWWSTWWWWSRFEDLESLEAVEEPGVGWMKFWNWDSLNDCLIWGLGGGGNRRNVLGLWAWLKSNCNAILHVGYLDKHGYKQLRKFKLVTDQN